MWISSIFRATAKRTVNPSFGAEYRQAAETRRIEVLVVTRDDRLFYSLFAVSMDIRWVIRRARTFEEAWQGLRWQPVQVVVYDGCLPQCDWKDALRSFSAFPGHPRVVLAAPEVDEDIWRAVLRCHGYDAVRRSAGQKEWIQMLRFAWLTRFREREGNRTADARIASLSVPIR
jgi:DNA-binding NarL/FixJ family response regulator